MMTRRSFLRWLPALPVVVGGGAAMGQTVAPIVGANTIRIAAAGSSVTVAGVHRVEDVAAHTLRMIESQIRTGRLRTIIQDVAR